MQDKFGNFLSAFAAAQTLRKRALDEKFYLENIILSAVMVDGLLRIALILSRQIEKKSSNINEPLICQESDKSYIPEREIFHLALDEEIIDEELYNKLNTLYDYRNKIIHRFFLHNIKYSNFRKTARDYESVIKSLKNIVKNYEEIQIKLDVGMTKSSRKKCDRIKEIEKMILRKI